ncbi:hypothetical protein [Nocardia wallacei]|uniref:hypothetical protein n=1 Tax=Nocardia wallacei TaxID=480035 RepID=UPI0024546F28|nr:hypothetical protein [Nocardia wallacei]
MRTGVTLADLVGVGVWAELRRAEGRAAVVDRAGGPVGAAAVLGSAPSTAARWAAGMPIGVEYMVAMGRLVGYDVMRRCGLRPCGSVVWVTVDGAPEIGPLAEPFASELAVVAVAGADDEFGALVVSELGEATARRLLTPNSAARVGYVWAVEAP